jgi:hypothetical protein
VPVREIPLTNNFRLVFYTVTVLTVVCAVGSVAIGLSGAKSPGATKVLDVMLAMTQVGFGAIVGLLSGKAL